MTRDLNEGGTQWRLSLVRRSFSERSEEISVFDAVFRFVDVMLILKNNEIMVKYEKILRWRMTTQDLGEELFVTAFLARHDLKNGR